MLFRKKVTPSCACCIHSAGMEDGNMICRKRGIVSADDRCRKFRYDPLKRVPSRRRALDFSQYDQQDFSL